METAESAGFQRSSKLIPTLLCRLRFQSVCGYCRPARMRFANVNRIAIHVTDLRSAEGSLLTQISVHLRAHIVERTGLIERYDVPARLDCRSDRRLKMMRNWLRWMDAPLGKANLPSWNNPNLVTASCDRRLTSAVPNAYNVVIQGTSKARPVIIKPDG
jgi:hypothetical protein